jgi:hypothetical protein
MLLLEGVTGVGKTYVLKALLKMFGYDCVLFVNEDAIATSLIEATYNALQEIYGRFRVDPHAPRTVPVVIIDDVDRLFAVRSGMTLYRYGRHCSRRDQLAAVEQWIVKHRAIVIFTGQRESIFKHVHLRSLRSLCRILELVEPDEEDLLRYTGIRPDDAAGRQRLRDCMLSCHGDVRQMLRRITCPVYTSDTRLRNKFEATRALFRTSSSAVTAIDTVLKPYWSEDHHNLLPMLQFNLPPGNLLSLLSEADLLMDFWGGTRNMAIEYVLRAVVKQAPIPLPHKMENPTYIPYMGRKPSHEPDFHAFSV